MSRFLSGPALLTKCRAGRGAIVVLEGENEAEDPFFYNFWFGDLAREVSFFPQNGWAKVVAAVRELREEIPDRHVFGIIDRDFADESVLVAQDEALPVDGVFRTRWYTLENYLLEPEGWLQCANVLCRRKLPEAWCSAEAVRARITQAYRRCLAVAAFNRVVHDECAREPVHDVKSLGYIEHPNGLTNSSKQRLLDWGRQRGAPGELDEAYAAHLAQLEQVQQSWPCWVTGKAVLKVFLDDFPTYDGKRPPRGHLINWYLREHSVPPPELAALVGRIVAASGG